MYGRGEGFGNQISIQNVAIVKAALKARRVYKVDTDNPVRIFSKLGGNAIYVCYETFDADETPQTWPVCHVIDNTNLYLQMLRNMLLGHDIGYNKQGFYLAASGSVRWNDLYASMAVALAKRNLVDDAAVVQADDAALATMGEALGVPPSFVGVMLGGK